MVDLKNLQKGNYIIHNKIPCIVQDIQLNLPNKTINLVLQAVFNQETFQTTLNLNQDIMEAEISRKCASIIAKKQDTLEIIDAISFKIFEAKIDPELLKQANENDQVTYMQYGNTAKIIEIIKAK